MNYDNINQIHEYWESNLSNKLTNRFNVPSFEEYLKRFAYLPSGKWIRDYDKIKIIKYTSPVNAVEFATEYENKCISYNFPIKSDEGYATAIYQISPTLHVLTTYWLWLENDNVHSYAAILTCLHTEKEYSSFKSKLWAMRKTGNSEDKPTPLGFGYHNI